MSFIYHKNDDGSLKVEDPVHGTIIVPYPFSKIVETKEMLRLNGIVQTGFCQYEFPGLKNDDRLSHSVGAFHTMSLILDKLEKDLKHYNISLSTNDKDIALCSMLLHDIGHGPFSHSLEGITSYSHEKRTTDILLGNTEIGNLLVELFGSAKVKQIASFIAEVDDKDPSMDDSFTKLLKNLISHQVDADRLDYLIRDSYYMGMPTGIDLNSLINNLSVVVNNNQEYELVINRKGLSCLENVLIHRYQMYRDVYLSPQSVLGDVIYKQIIDRYRSNPKLSELPVTDNFKLISSNPRIPNLDDFTKMSDGDFIKSFEVLRNNDIDKVLAYISDFSHMKDYELLENDIPVSKIRTSLEEVFGRKIDEDTLSIISVKTKNKLYKSEQKLNIQDGNKIVNITDCTNLIKPHENFENKYIFFNPELLRIELNLSEEEYKKYESDVRKLIEEFNKKPEEFELKYIVTDKDKRTLDEIIQAFIDDGYHIVSTSSKQNNDEYYDTKDLSVLHKGGSLRIRKCTEDGKTKNKGTFKMPSCEGTVYTSRIEIEESLDTPEFDSFKTIMESKELPIDLNPIVKIPLLNSINNRTDTVLEKDGIEVCLSFDDVTYRSHILDGETTKDCMIEIEALGNVNDRVALNNIHEFITRKIKGIKINKQSKYERGFNSTLISYRNKQESFESANDIIVKKLEKYK